jgi:hypothetical protein
VKIRKRGRYYYVQTSGGISVGDAYTSRAAATRAMQQMERNGITGRRRRHRAAENPTSNTTRWLVIGGLTAVAGVGLYLYMKKTAAPQLPPKPPTP